MLDHNKDKVETPPNVDAPQGSAHVHVEAVNLLSQAQTGYIRTPEPLNGHIDFNSHGHDFYRHGHHGGGHLEININLGRPGGPPGGYYGGGGYEMYPPRGPYQPGPPGGPIIYEGGLPGRRGGYEGPVGRMPGDYSTIPEGRAPQADIIRVNRDESVKDLARDLLGPNANYADMNRMVGQLETLNHIGINGRFHRGQEVLIPHMEPGPNGPRPRGDMPPQQPRHSDHRPQGPADHAPQGPADHTPRPADHTPKPADSTPPPAKPSDNQNGTYTVKPGDNLWKIEKQLLGPHASNAEIARGVKELARLNHIPMTTDSRGHVQALIRPGDHLKLPPGLGGEHPAPARPEAPTKPPEAPAKPPEVPAKPPEAPTKPPETPTKPPEAPAKPPEAPTKPPEAPAKPPEAPDHQRPGERPFMPRDRREPYNAEEVKNSPERQQLMRDAEAKLANNPTELAKFKQNMTDLENRATRDHLSSREIRETYQQIDRLMNTQGDRPLRADQRLTLAEQVMKQSAHPEDIDQGQHGTCALNNAVESRMYHRHPANAAKVVADVATTGQYTTRDGLTVNIDATPHGESLLVPTPDGSRSHASEIFQLTAANIRLERENRKTNPPGQLRYEHHDSPPGSGMKDEVIMNYAKHPPEVVQDDPGFTTGNDGQLRDIYRSITGDRETGVIVGHDSYLNDTSDGCKRIHSEQELNDYLAQAKAEGKFPLSISLDTTSEPFWTDSGNGSAGGSGGGHILNINDYIPGNPPTVTVDNSWGRGADHFGARAITTHDLYQAMDAPRNKPGDMRADAEYDRAAGHPNHWKELEAARLQHALDGRNPASDQKYETAIMQEMQQMQRDWAAHPDNNDRGRSMQKLQRIMESFSPEARERLQNEKKRLGI